MKRRVTCPAFDHPESAAIHELQIVSSLRDFLSTELGDVAVFVNGLSALIGLALFELHGFSTDGAVGTPLALEYIFG